MELFPKPQDLEEYAQRCAEWLQRRVAQAEADDPLLRPMKDNINQISDQLTHALPSEMRQLLAEQDAAIQTLLKHISA